MASTISQFSCFYSSINARSHLRTRSSRFLNFRPKVFIVKCHDGHGTEISSSDGKATLSCASDAAKSSDDTLGMPYISNEESANGNVMSDPVPIAPEQKRAAKIHDFCFGIPFGGLVLSGGLLGFIFSRNPATLCNGVLFGGALLALSTYSLKIWRQGKSSFPFILGQAVLAATLLWKNFKNYLTSCYAVLLYVCGVIRWKPAS